MFCHHVGPYQGQDHVRQALLQPWVAAHEYTHALHHKALGGIWRGRLITNCRGHELRKPSGYKCALKEGLADYGGNLGSSSRWSYNFETIKTDPPSGKGAGEIEGNVAALFQDLLDSNNDGNDRTDYPGYYVMMVFKTCKTPTAKRDDTADFVWCLERAVNEDVHDDHFPGLSTPSGVSWRSNRGIGTGTTFGPPGSRTSANEGTPQPRARTPPSVHPGAAAGPKRSRNPCSPGADGYRRITLAERGRASSVSHVKPE